MTATFHNGRLAGAPVLMAFNGAPADAARKGTVLFYHGFTASKEANRGELASLADSGFLAVGVDNVGHGERRDPEWEAKFGPGGNWARHFRQLTRRTAEEVGAVIDALAGRGLAERVGVCGISMGGMIGYESLVCDQRVRAVAAVVSSPRYISDAERLARLFPAAILSQTGGLDEIVAFEDVARFHRALAPYYAAAPERQQWIHYPESPHIMRPQDWDAAWRKTLAWFDCHLSGD